MDCITYENNDNHQISKAKIKNKKISGMLEMRKDPIHG
jgi:hypothetical protein